jgi:hypothetical protein
MPEEAKTEGWDAATTTTEKPDVQAKVEPTAPDGTGKPAEEGKAQAQPVVTDSKEYKTLQTKLNKANEELSRLRANHASTATIEARTAKMEQILEAMVDEFGSTVEQEEGQPPAKSRLKQRYEAIRGQTEAQTKQAKQAEEAGQRAFNRIAAIAKKTGLDLDGAELEAAKELFNKGDYDGAIEEVYEARLNKMQAQMDAKVEAKLKARNEEETADSVDTSASMGTGTGRSFTRQQIRKMSPDEYTKNYEAIDAAERAGRIK